MPIPKFPPGSPGHLATVGEGGPETIQLVGNKWVQPPKSSARFYVYAALDQWMAWTYTTFDKATALSALNKASDELKEAKHEIIRESPGAPGSSLVLEELADVILCVFSSAAKLGFSVEQVFLAIKEKAKINYEREWIYDPQTQTYSHKKPSKQ